MFEAPSDGAVVRFDSLDPRWGTMHAREPGHYRWLISYYGGGEGYLNENRSTGLISDRGHAGIMHLTSGCRQFGVHEHTVTEIYVILQGEVESIEPGRTQKAGPLDALYMPPKAPHAVRASGDEDVVLFFCHDAGEQIGKSIYYDESDDRWSSPPRRCRSCAGPSSGRAATSRAPTSAARCARGARGRARQVATPRSARTPPPTTWSRSAPPRSCRATRTWCTRTRSPSTTS